MRGIVNIISIGLFLSAAVLAEDGRMSGEMIVIHEGAQYLAYRSNGLPADQIKVFHCGDAQSKLLTLQGTPVGSIVIDGHSLHYLSNGQLFSHELATGKLKYRACPDICRLDDFYQIGMRTVMLTIGSNRELTILFEQDGKTLRKTPIPWQDLGPYKGSTLQGDKVFFFFSDASGPWTVNWMYSISTGQTARVEEQKILLNSGVTLQGSNVLCGPKKSFRLMLDSALTRFWSTKEVFVIETTNRLYLYKENSSGVLLHNESDQSLVDIALLSCGPHVYDAEEGRWYSEAGVVPK